MTKVITYVDSLALYTYYCAIQVENINAVMPGFDYRQPVQHHGSAGAGFCWVEQNGIKAIVPTDAVYSVLENVRPT